MPQLFIITGPQGVGKSSAGQDFAPTNIDILNHDALFIHYRAKGELDLQELSNLKANDFLLKIE
jgi:predicted ABC-type ATPase